jgi:hypothetical protein
MYISGSGGSCDCGMADAMLESGFCPAHRPEQPSPEIQAHLQAWLTQHTDVVDGVRLLLLLLLGAEDIFGEVDRMACDCQQKHTAHTCAVVQDRDWACEVLLSHSALFTLGVSLALDYRVRVRAIGIAMPAAVGLLPGRFAERVGGCSGPSATTACPGSTRPSRV